MSGYGAVDALMAILIAKPKALLADKGHDGDAVRENLLMHGILPIIPSKANPREPIPSDFRRYRDRNRIERMFEQLEQFCRVATRYDKTALSFASFLNLAAIRKWLGGFVASLVRSCCRDMTAAFLLSAEASATDSLHTHEEFHK